MTDDLITTRQMESQTPTPQSNPNDEEAAVQPVTYEIYRVTMAMGVNAAPVATWRASSICTAAGIAPVIKGAMISPQLGDPLLLYYAK